MSQREPDDRMTDFEIGLSHVQRAYEQLNEVVTEQAKEMLKMQRRIDQLQHQLKSLKEKPEPSVDPLEEQPPHY